MDLNVQSANITSWRAEMEMEIEYCMLSKTCGTGGRSFRDVVCVFVGQNVFRSMVIHAEMKRCFIKTHDRNLRPLINALIQHTECVHKQNNVQALPIFAMQ